MRAVCQRVSSAQVSVDGKVTGAIGAGLCVLVGVAQGDTETDAAWLAAKVCELRIFEDAQGKMNLSVLENKGAILAVSQFTLLGDARTGRRPAFTAAAPPEIAKGLYDRFCALCRERGLDVQEGVFRATMQVSLVNEGPVTLLLDSRKLF